MNETEEILEIVDENNQVIKQATRGEAYEKGLLHRAISVFVFNSKGEVFLQQRSERKMKYPLAWDVSAAEHVKVGESFEDAAVRGVKEELGISIPLDRIRSIHRQDNGPTSENDRVLDYELVETFKGFYDGEIILDIGEVNDGRFLSLTEIQQMVDSGNIPFTSWFLDEWSNCKLS